uniref:glycosyltransferase n=2 Tax=Roseivirga sp. TaxID=1964215 RepID=UPI004047F18C
MVFELIFILVFILMMVTQLYYHWHYFALLLNFRSSPSYPPVPVSVVVAARNEAKNLPFLISKILEQAYPIFELIIVNDRSIDHSSSILNELKTKDPRLKVIHVTELAQGWNGKKQALQLGIQSAQHEIILLTDADCIPSSNQWINEMASCFGPKTDFVLGVSPYQKEKGILNQFIQFETLFTAIQYLSFALKGQPYMGVGRNLAYRKSVFQKHSFSGYEDKMGGDDDLFVNAHANGLNTRICISHASQMLSIPKLTWKEYFIQKIRHLSVGKSYQKKDQTRLGIFALSSLIGWIMLILAVFTGMKLTLILVIFSIRSLSFYAIFIRSGQKLNVNLAFWALPFFDLCFNLYYPILGLVALLAKKVKWS